MNEIIKLIKIGVNRIEYFFIVTSTFHISVQTEEKGEIVKH